MLSSRVGTSKRNLSTRTKSGNLRLVLTATSHSCLASVLTRIVALVRAGIVAFAQCHPLAAGETNVIAQLYVTKAKELIAMNGM